MKKSKVSGVLRQNAIIIVVVLMFVFFSVTQSTFLTVNNIMNVLRQISIMGIVAVGSTFVLIGGGLDLSVGSQIAVTGTLTGALMTTLGWNPWVAALFGILAAILIGLINGMLIQFVRLPSMIATLGTMTSARGVAYLISGGLPIYNLPDDMKFVGKGTVFGVIPVPVIIMLVCFLAGYIVLEMSYLGNYFYAIGGNAEAARLAGINVKRFRIASYVINGLMCGIAGLVMLYRVNSGQPTAAEGLEMDVITGCVLGGVSLSGGEGKIYRVLMGCLVVGLLSNGLTMMQVNEYWQKVFTGIVLILAVTMDMLTKVQRVKKVKAA